MKLQFQDIQGFVFTGYGKNMNNASYLLFQINNSELAKNWISNLMAKDNQKEEIHITDAVDRPTRFALNIAFTFSGLIKLGLNTKILKDFPVEFQEGMAKRSTILGDYSDSSVENWQWGDFGKSFNQDYSIKDIDFLLLVFANNEEQLQDLVKELQNTYRDIGVVEVNNLGSLSLNKRPSMKEHFGFRDGIGQPVIEGTKQAQTASAGNLIRPGEILLGYPNENNNLDGPTNSASPGILLKDDPNNILPLKLNDPNKKDLGLNGTYLVFRQLNQNVREFWEFIDGQTQNVDKSCNYEELVKMASKMVGRWPSGIPLVLSPESDDLEMDVSQMDKFLFLSEDPQGYKCPIGSHIRRTNPRDHLRPSPDRKQATSSKESIRVLKRHRIIRRGRIYGNPLAPSFLPEDFLKAGYSNEERGLHFICLNASISKQFEFIQRTWINNSKFGSLYDEDDPITGSRLFADSLGKFTLQEYPINKQITAIPNFLQVKGGGYFFMPGIKALTYLANI